MNVLVYAGPGTSEISVTHSIGSLRNALHSEYTIKKVTPEELATPSWIKTCALLLIPGGRDLPYVASLHGPANQNIRRFVQEGGRYMGICAGAYYSSAKLKWEEGTPIQVVGNRPLGFYPGTSVGCVYSGFNYATEDGARCVRVELEDDDGGRKVFAGIYYNGGGHFDGADDPNMRAKGVRILARYIDGEGKGKVSAVSCDVGEGRAILWGPHFEFPLDAQPANTALRRQEKPPTSECVTVMENERVELIRHTLALLGVTLAAPLVRKTASDVKL